MVEEQATVRREAMGMIPEFEPTISMLSRKNSADNLIQVHPRTDKISEEIEDLSDSEDHSEEHYREHIRMVSINSDDTGLREDNDNDDEKEDEQVVN